MSLRAYWKPTRQPSFPGPGRVRAVEVVPLLPGALPQLWNIPARNPSLAQGCSTNEIAAEMRVRRGSPRARPTGTPWVGSRPGGGSVQHRRQRRRCPDQRKPGIRLGRLAPVCPRPFVSTTGLTMGSEHEPGCFSLVNQCQSLMNKRRYSYDTDPTRSLNTDPTHGGSAENPPVITCRTRTVPADGLAVPGGGGSARRGRRCAG